MTASETLVRKYNDTVSILDQVGIPYTVYEHPDVPIVDYESERVARDRYRRQGHPTKSVLVVEKGTGRALVIFTLPEKRRIDWKEFARSNNLRKLSIGTDEELIGRTGCQPGALVPIGLDREISIWIDRALLQYERVLLSIGGSTTRSLEIRTSDLERIFDSSLNPHEWVEINTIEE